MKKDRKNVLFFYSLSLSTSYESFQREIYALADMISPRIIDESEKFLSTMDGEFTEDQKKWAHDFFVDYRSKERRDTARNRKLISMTKSRAGSIKLKKRS